MDVENLRQRREALLLLRADGILRARFGEDEVHYKSDRDMAAAIAALETEIASQSGTRVRTFLPHFSKGL